VFDEIDSIEARFETSRTLRIGGERLGAREEEGDANEEREEQRCQRSDE